MSKNSKGMATDSVSKAMDQLSQSMPKMTGGNMPGIDLNKILSDIKTTTSKVDRPKIVEVKPAEVKNPNSSESYKINGKEVGKEDFDKHMQANPELAKLMEGIKPKAGGDSAGADPAANALSGMKSMQDQISKLREEEAKKELENKKNNIEKTQQFAEQQLAIHGKTEQEKAKVTQSITLNTLGLNAKQKEMHGELAKLTLDESKAKLEANKKQQEATLAEMRALDAKANAIEETAKKEGRALTESEQAQVNAIDSENEAKLKAVSKANATMADENKVLEKLIKQKTFAEKEGLEVYIKKDGERVKLVEENSAKIAQDMKEALPVKEIAEKKTEFSDQLSEAGKTLDDHGKSTLKYAMTYSSEANAVYKDGAEQSIKNTQSEIEEKNKIIAEIEEKGKTQELSEREKKRIEITKGEIKELEEKKKFREQEVEAYTIAENLKKGIVTESTAKISETLADALPVKDIEKGKELLEERIKLQNEAEEKAALADEEEIARIEVAAQAKFAADEEARIAREEIDAFLPKSIDLGKERIRLQTEAEEQAALAEEEEIARLETQAQAKFTYEDKKPAAADASTPKFSDITLDANGMPVVKSKSKELAKKEDPKPPTPSPGKKINPETGQEYTPVDESAAKTNKEGGKEQKSNLDDVVKTLEKLNNTMNSLIKKTEEASANQVKATKGIASGNLFGAH
jgi:hypothetical protein